MSAEDGEVTIADKALSAAGTAAKGVATGFKKAKNFTTEKISTAKGSTILKIMNIGNIVVAILHLIVYPFGFITSSIGMSIVTILMAAYCICFALMLIFFETKMKKTEVFIKKYFGFIYTYNGRTFFCLFMTAMVLGQTEGKSVFWLSLVAFIVGLVNVLFNLIVVCSHPDFQKGGQYYSNGAITEETAKADATAPKKKPTKPTVAEAAPAEANPFASSSDEDIPAARVPEKKPAKKTNKKAAKEENPFEDDNPFDD